MAYEDDVAVGRLVTTPSASQRIRERIQAAGARYWANDNIAEFLDDGDKDDLIDELTERFAGVLDTLVIDRVTDSNSADTARRLAKMYINELMEGRYHARPRVAAFPNDNSDDRYTAMLVVREELKSICSPHQQPGRRTTYIGIIHGVQAIGLSK